MDFDLHIEPIVSKDEIWVTASQHADAGDETPHRNPYPPGTRAHNTYEIYFYQRVRELNGETYS